MLRKGAARARTSPSDPSLSRYCRNRMPASRRSRADSLSIGTTSLRAAARHRGSGRTAAVRRRQPSAIAMELVEKQIFSTNNALGSSVGRATVSCASLVAWAKFFNKLLGQLRFACAFALEKALHELGVKLPRAELRVGKDSGDGAESSCGYPRSQTSRAHATCGPWLRSDPLRAR